MTEHLWLDVGADSVLLTVERPASGAAVARGSGVLICPPYGWHEMTSYRGLRTWARSLASSGHLVARIDLPGCGDSSGSPLEPGRLTAWRDAVRAGAAWLREEGGPSRVTVLGISLGGFLAVLAAAGGEEVDDLILWAVPSRGRTLMRELRAHAGMIAARYSEDANAPEGSGPVAGADAAEGDGAVELAGFPISAEAVQGLEATDLTTLELTDASQRRILLLGRDRLGVDKRLRAHLESLGAAVTIEDGVDYDELLANPQMARAPGVTIQTTLGWLEACPAAARRAKGGRRPAVRHEITLTTQHGPIRERMLAFDLPGGTAYGVLSSPVEHEASGIAALLSPAGALRRTGPNRLWVDLARKWAAEGVPTLRLDLPGTGDGEGQGEDRELVSNACLYDDARDGQILTVLGELAQRGVGERFILGGLCSGAYWALHAALADARVLGALMINLYTFWWSSELAAEREPGEALTVLRGGGWQRLVRGDVAPGRVLEAVGSLRPRRLRAARRRGVEDSHNLPMFEALDQLRDQDKQLLMLFSADEALLDQMTRQGHLGQLSRWPNLVVERLPTRDHMFRALWLQRLVRGHLDAALERMVEHASRHPVA